MAAAVDGASGVAAALANQSQQRMNLQQQPVCHLNWGTGDLASDRHSVPECRAAWNGADPAAGVAVVLADAAADAGVAEDAMSAGKDSGSQWQAASRQKRGPERTDFHRTAARRQQVAQQRTRHQQPAAPGDRTGRSRCTAARTGAAVAAAALRDQGPVLAGSRRQGPARRTQERDWESRTWGRSKWKQRTLIPESSSHRVLVTAPTLCHAYHVCFCWRTRSAPAALRPEYRCGRTCTRRAAGV